MTSILLCTILLLWHGFMFNMNEKLIYYVILNCEKYKNIFTKLIIYLQRKILKDRGILTTKINTLDLGRISMALYFKQLQM